MIFVCSGDVVNHHGTQLFHGPDFGVQGLVRELVTKLTVHLPLSQSACQARLCLTIDLNALSLRHDQCVVFALWTFHVFS